MAVTNAEAAPDQPVRFIPADNRDRAPEPGLALCLSGGGYRAMLFHLGSLWRLHELGLLRQLKRISSVSGGSITAGLLGLRWRSVIEDPVGDTARFRELVGKPIRGLASRTIDVWSIIGGLLTPGSVGEKVAGAYDRHLFQGATLQDLPADGEGPRLVINATNVQTGSLWRFSRPYMGDWQVGLVANPRLPLCLAVAASSAFPPVLSPLRLQLAATDFTDFTGATHTQPPYTTSVVLADGGVYDNLGLETAWKRYRTILVSDAGGRMEPEPRPARNWANHSFRVLNLIDNQVRSLRKRQVIASYKLADGPLKRDGTYWGIWSQVKDYQLPDALDCPEARTEVLAKTPTRLAAIEDRHQERLINWGYAICDTAIRKHVMSGVGRPAGFPYPASGV